MNPTVAAPRILENYLRAGFRIFPLQPQRKEPARPVRSWSAEATSDLGTVSRWLRSCPGCNWALACGKESEVFAIDVDSYKGLPDKVAHFVERLEESPTLMQRTPRGGTHYLFKYPAEGKVGCPLPFGVGAGVEVKGEGGYIVVAPSVNAEAVEYEWLDQFDAGAIAEPPGWLLDMLQHNEDVPAAATPCDPSPVRDRLIARAARYVSGVAGTAAGGRNSTAFSLAGHVAAFRENGSDAALGSDDIVTVLETWNTRCRPPLSQQELRRAAESALKNGTPRPDKVGAHAEVDDWEDPTPLDDRRAPEFPEPPDGLIPEFWEFCAAIRESLQVPVDLPAMVGLSIVGAGLAKRCRVHVKGDWLEPTNIYTCTVLDPANRKSACFEAMAEPLHELEHEARERDALAVQENASQWAVLEGQIKAAQQKLIKKSKDMLAARAELTELNREKAEFRRIYPPVWVVDDITPEAVCTMLHQNGERLAILSSEGGLFQMMAGRYGNVPNLDCYLKGHAGDALKVHREHREAESLRAPHLSIGLTVQMSVLRDLAKERSFRGRGLIARFFFSIPQSSIGRRSLDPPPIPEGVREGWRRLVRAVWSVRGEHRFTFARDARPIIDGFQAECESDLADGGDLCSMLGWGGKLCGGVARLCGILHGSIWSRDQAAGLEIGRPTAEYAVRLGRYLKAHAMQAYGELGSDGSMDRACRLLQAIQDRRAAVFSRRDAYMWIRGRGEPVEIVDRPIEILVDFGHLRSLEQESRPGRPSVRYEVNPKVHGG